MAEHMIRCSCPQAKCEIIEEDTQLGGIGQSAADYCLNYTGRRTVFIPAGLSFASGAVLLVLHYVVYSHMHAHAHRQTRACVNGHQVSDSGYKFVSSHSHHM